MRERRFLINDLSSGSEVQIRGDEAHHLLHVLRLQPGDEVVVFDGRGSAYRAVLTECGRSAATARRLEAIPSRESQLECWIAVAVPKSDKMRFVVQKLTELGTSRITPLLAARRSLAPTAQRLSSWRRVSVEACKQSGRELVPTIDEPIRLEDLLDQRLPSCRLLICPGGPGLPNPPEKGSCLALVGPEGGWTEKEISAAMDKEFLKLGLGPRTLRTETAAIATTSILQWAWGDLG